MSREGVIAQDDRPMTSISLCHLVNGERYRLTLIIIASSTLLARRKHSCPRVCRDNHDSGPATRVLRKPKDGIDTLDTSPRRSDR
jgi:hypothetical protein